MNQQIRKKIEKQSLLRPVMVLLLCFMILFSSCYVKPVKADAAVTGVTVAGCVAVSAALAALGIGVAASMNNESYTQACTNIWNGISTGIQSHVKVISDAAGYITANLSSDFLHAVVKGMVAVYPPKALDFSTVNSTASFAAAMGWQDTYKLATSHGCWNNMDFSYFTNYQVLQSVDSPFQSFTMLGIKFNVDYSSYSKNYRFAVDTSSCSYSEVDKFLPDIIWPGQSYKISLLQVYNKSAGEYQYLILTSNGGYFYWLSSGVKDIANPPVAPSIPDVYNPADKSLYADGYSIMNHKVDDVINRVGALQGIQAGINVRLSDAVGTLMQINDAVKSLTQSQVTTVDASNTAEKTADDTANKERDTTAPKNPTMPDMTIPQAITRKFPFSIPWDLYNSIANLVSPGEAPIWKIPFKNEKLGFDYSVTLDMSQYNNLAALMRWGLSLLFLMGLILVTNKLIKH